MRVRWLIWLSWLAGLGCLWLNLLPPPPLRSGACVRDVGAESATVGMISAVPRRLSCTVRDVAGNVVATVASDAERRRQALRVNGLQPGNEYRFTVVEQGTGAVLDTGSFRTSTTDDRAPVRFAFLGDSGGMPWWVWLQRTPMLHLPARWELLPDGSEVTAIGAAVAAWRPDFVLHLGDVVYPWGQNAGYATGFFRPFAEVLRHAPVYAVLGNHDMMDADGLQMLDNLALPASPQTGDGRCFSFASGPLRVIGLDCNADRLGGRFLATHPAKEYLDEQLRACTEPWIVVASHFPVLSQSRARNRGDLMVNLLPALRDHHVSLYLAGHDHCYQRFLGPGDEGGPPLVVSGGGGKSLYDVRPDPRFVVESAYHWCSAEVLGGTLSVRAHRLDGSELDHFELTLPTGAAVEAIRAVNPGRAGRIEALRGPR